MRKRKWLIGSGVVGVLAVALLLGGLVMGVFAQTSPVSSAIDQASTLFSDPTITADEAKAAVLEAYPGTTATEVELEKEHGVLVYEVELNNGLEILVDADTGAVLGPEQEGADGAADDADGAADDADGATDDADNLNPIK
jgi:uncharacterized membrane protein YkoI